MYSHTLSSLIGGVSKQPKYSRSDSQCEDLKNVELDYLRGIKKRPGSTFESELASFTYSLDTQTVYKLFELSNGEKYIVFFIPDDTTPIKIFDVDGTEQTIQYIGGALDSSADLKAYATKVAAPSSRHKDNGEILQLGDTLIAINKIDSPAMYPAPTTLDSEELVKQINTIYVKQFLPNTTYQVTVSDSEYDSTTQSVTTGDTGDTATIASLLEGAIATALLSFGTGVEVISTHTDSTSVINVQRAAGGLSAAGTLTVSVSDGAGHNAIVCGKNSLPSISDLPPNYPYGSRVFEIKGGEEQGGFFLEYNPSENAWEECAKLGIEKAFNLEFLPLAISKDTVSANTFNVLRFELDGRLVGDNETAPLPSFVDQPISNIFFFKNRLGFVSGNNVILSAIGEYTNFFPKTALESLDSDPIDISISPEKSSFLQYAIPFDTGIILSTFDEQFLLTGDGNLFSPLSASILPISSYPLYLKPHKAQDYLYFISGREDKQKLFRYQVTTDTNRYKAIDISGNVAGYLTNVSSIYFDERTDKLLLKKKNSTGVYVLYAKEVFDGEGIRTVGGWSYWEFPTEINPLGNIEEDFYFLAKNGVQVILCSIPVLESDYNIDFIINDPTTLEEATIGEIDYYVYTLPYRIEDLKVYWIDEGDVTEVQIDLRTPVSSVETEVFIPKAIYENKVEAILGIGMEFEYEFSTFYPRDKNGNAITTGQTVLRGLQLEYTDTTSMKVGVQQRGGSKYYLEGLDNYPFSVISDTPETGGMYFPVFGNNEWITISLEDISPYSLLVNQATFIYSYNNRFRVF